MIDRINSLSALYNSIVRNAPKRKAVFDLINGKRTVDEIIEATKRPRNSILNDIRMMASCDLIELKSPDKKIYRKNTLLSLSRKSARGAKDERKVAEHNNSQTRRPGIAKPTKTKILNLIENRENGNVEFKDDRVAAEKIAKEICGMLNTGEIGYILLGVTDQRDIVGCTNKFEHNDERIQSCVVDTIKPAPKMLISRHVLLDKELVCVSVFPSGQSFTFKGKKYYRRGTVTVPASQVGEGWVRSIGP